MDVPEPSRVELLLMRAFDGEADEAERAELLAWSEAEPRLAALSELRAALREALAAPGPCDVAADVMALLAEEDAWTPLGGLLVEALRSDGPAPLAALDVVDGVMAALADEDEARWAPVGSLIADAVRAEAGTVDVWGAVAEVVDAEPAGWAPVAEALRAELVTPDAPVVDVADAVMDVVAPVSTVVPLPVPAGRGGFPRWASLGVPLAAVASLAAAALLFVLSSGPGPVIGPGPEAATEVLAAVAPLASTNDALVEELSTGEAVVAAQVMQFEEGGPTIIFVEEAEL